MKLISPSNWNLQYKLIIPPVISLLVVLCISSMLNGGRVDQVLLENEDALLEQQELALDGMLAQQLQTMQTTMKLTVIQNGLYDGFFAAQTDDFDFLKDFLLQARELAQVDDVVVVQDDATVLLRANSKRRGDSITFRDKLQPIFAHGDIRDKGQQLADTIQTWIQPTEQGYQLVAVGPVLDVESIVGAIIMIKQLDQAFLESHLWPFGDDADLWIATPSELIATTNPDWQFPLEQLAQGTMAFDTKFDQQIYRHRAVELIAGKVFLGVGQNMTANKQARSGLWMVQLTSLLIALGVISLILWLNVRIITRKIALLASYAKAISKGKLDITVQHLGQDEIGEMGRNMEEMCKSLILIAKLMTKSIAGLVDHSARLAETTESLVANIEEENRTIDQNAVAVTEMAQSSLEVTRNAEETATTSTEASDLASQGKSIVENTVSGMSSVVENVSQSANIIKALGNSSDEVGNIVSVIDGIAEQTNLLALNAAIEAARAGEQGRGFAVVADEVRQLAKRTGEATKEISEKISSIQNETVKAVQSMDDVRHEVENSMEITQNAQKAMEGIVTASAHSNQMVTMIATASEHQAIATESVSQGMNTITGLTEKLASASHGMQQQAQELKSMSDMLGDTASWFKLKKSG